MNENLSRMIAELFARAMEGKELSSEIQRLGDEVRKAFEGEQSLYGKFRGLLESLRPIIPDEKQRYQAALQALSTTAKVNRREIIKAINDQREELKMLEKGLMPSLPGWRDGLKIMLARSQELRGEMTKLRERLTQLEAEEKAVLAGIATREKDVELAEKTIGELVASIGAEMAALNKKIEALTAEGPGAQPASFATPPTQPAVPPIPPAAQAAPHMEPPKTTAPAAKKAAGEPTIEINMPPPPQDTKWHKKCPMCGGQMSLLELENMWQCYTCAHEESTDTAQIKGTPSSETVPERASNFVVEPLASVVNDGERSKKGPSHFDSPPAAKKKPCPACRKKMYWYPAEKAWRCPSCLYERRI